MPMAKALKGHFYYRWHFFPMWAVFWVGVTLISHRRHVHHARTLLSIFDLWKDTMSLFFFQTSLYLVAAKRQFASSLPLRLYILGFWILSEVLFVTSDSKVKRSSQKHRINQHYINSQLHTWKWFYVNSQFSLGRIHDPLLTMSHSSANNLALYM